MFCENAFVEKGVMEPKWLEWAKKLQAIAQNGLTYSENPYDLERYKVIRAIAQCQPSADRRRNSNYLL